MLTEDQIHHFRVFGFIVLRQVLNEAKKPKNWDGWRT